MAQDGLVNVRQPLRERHAADGVMLVGLASHRGEVIEADACGRAAPRWAIKDPRGNRSSRLGPPDSNRPSAAIGPAAAA